MKTYPITLGEKTYEVVQHDDGTFEMPEELRRWKGFGTALKPSVEVWWLCRKPIEAQSVAAQVLKTGTGAINIDETRVKHASPDDLAKHQAMVTAIKARGGSMENSWKNSSDLSGANDVKTEGRWPANFVLTHSPECKKVGTKKVPAPVINRFDDGMKPFGEGAGHPYTSSGGGEEEQPVYECVEGCPVREMNEQSGTLAPGHIRTPTGQDDRGVPGFVMRRVDSQERGIVDTGGASRFFQTFEAEPPFFYTAKANKSEKNEGLGVNWDGKQTNSHPTVKPVSLMRYLVKMITPKGGVVLDPFAGSGSTLVAAIQEGDKCIGIEREDEYVKIARKRVKEAERFSKQPIDPFAAMAGLGGDDEGTPK
jgi:site-specific DNA-methyltransferase (adenine-specific)